jgi:hypothetical protein
VKHKPPKHFLEAHRLISGRAKLVRKAHSKAEYNHLVELRSLFHDPNIVGLGIANKLTNKKRVDELTLCFYVKEKKAKRRLSSHKMIPPVLSVSGRKSIFTDVYQIGTLRAQINRQAAPIESGFSVGNERVEGAGTVGAIVTSDGASYILSNGHVLAPRGANVDVNAIYPAFVDANGIHRVGPLRDIVPLQMTGNVADAALAEIVGGLAIQPGIPLAKQPYSVTDPSRDMVIVGTGRTSGRMDGTVRDIHFRGSVIVPGLGSVQFVDQAICDNYSQPGDSGAVIIEQGTGAIVGLHVAGSDEGSMFTPMSTVRDNLTIKFQFT